MGATAWKWPDAQAPAILGRSNDTRSLRTAGQAVELTPKQRAHLKSLAHHLNPVLFVGKEGVTDQTVRSLEEAFNTRELLKVKILEAAPMGTREGAEALAARIEGAVAVQAIGRVGVLYRRHPDKPEIELPA